MALGKYIEYQRAVGCLLAIGALLGQARGADRNWPMYLGSADAIHYSPLDQINRANVQNLQVAWTYDTGDAFRDSEMQCNPLIVDGILYATSPRVRVIALDAATGKLRWSFDPLPGVKALGKIRNRGLMYWSDGGRDQRIYVAARQWLYALDARTGRPAPGFGIGGRIDLREGLGRDPETLSVSASTPGVIYKDLLILGSIVPEDLPSSPGDIRAFDVRTGKTRWIFHTIPHPGEFGYETWPKDAWKHSGGANNWAGMALDARRGLVFVPTGSAAFDFYGADRLGDNLFANCLLALKAETGERVWHFQSVRHDVWDRDFPSPPALVTLHRDGRAVDAVVQIAKSGWVFVFERETGKPLFPIEYRRVPASDVDGEELATMQPFPLKPPPFARQALTEDIVTRRTPEARETVLKRLRELRSGGQFTPPSLQGTIIFPGLDGGGEWGGPAFDPSSGMLYVNSNEMAWVLRLVERSSGGLYGRHCAGCHGADLRGSPPEFPNLLSSKMTEAQMADVIQHGAGRMPAFSSSFSAGASEALARYVKSGGKAPAPKAGGSAPVLKYRLDGYGKFLDPDGYPPVEPPWGTLNAINLETGEIAWRIPFGEFPELVAKGIRNTGSENYGGPVVTAGGLIFIGATNHDRKFHAFDKDTGKLLWETMLPAAGNATPAIYEVNGRQFVVIAAGGGKWGNPSGGSYVAFALKPGETGRARAGTARSRRNGFQVR